MGFAKAGAQMFTGTKRFRLVSILGRGSMGVVYRVHDAEMATDVALKTLEAARGDQLYHLKREFRLLADISHPNLVELFELVVSSTDSFFTMELVEGVDFTTHLRRDSPNIDGQLRQFLDAARQLVMGVAALHAAGKLHRDVKPSNIRVTREGRVVLLDFGLATTLAYETGSDGVAGTLAYMAPEQGWSAPPAPTADWYSVGVVLYEALTGRRPFHGPAVRMLQQKAEAPPPPPRTLVADVPDELDALITALLDPDPARRPGADEILGRLAGRPAVQPRCGAPVDDLPFVGRADEMASLRAAFASVARGQGVTVHIHGPSGIGKTELVRRFLSWVEQQPNAVVLRGRCHPQEDVPYKALDALVDALSRQLVGLPDLSAAALVPRHAGALLRVFPVLARVTQLAAWPIPDDAEPYEVRRRAAMALRDLLGKLADRQPLALWIDDLQWGDPDSAAVLRELVRAPDAPAMLLLLSYRSADTNRMPLPFGLQDDAEELPREIRLGPLDDVETRELVTRLAGSELGSAEEASSIAAECAGSPFLASQLVHDLNATVPTGASHGSAAERLAEVVSARVAQLPAVARHVLEVVSVAGRPLDRSVVLEAAGVGERGRMVLTHLEQQRLIASTPRAGLTAVEVITTGSRGIAGSLPGERVRERHCAIARSLERLVESDPQELFAHYLGGGCRGRGALCRPGRGPGARPWRSIVRRTSIGSALRLRQDLADDWTVHTRMAEALANAGRGAEAGERFEAAAAALAGSAPQHEEISILRRRAADQYLRSGHVDRGTALMRVVLAELDISLPSSGRGAMASALLQRLRLLRRGMAITLRPPAKISARVAAADGVQAARPGSRS
jgi:hypothetical protein